MGKVEAKLNSGFYLLEQPKQEIISAFELTQARAFIEGETAVLAALNITDRELFDLEQCFEEMKNGDPEKADENFHLIIAKSTRNKAILMTVKELWNIKKSNQDIRMAYKNVCYRNDVQRLKEHQKILIALQNHQVEHARVAMHEHFKRLINALFEVSETEALEKLREKININDVYIQSKIYIRRYLLKLVLTHTPSLTDIS